MSCFRNASASAELRQPRTAALSLTELTVPEAINHRSNASPTIVLLHGFPSSSHMFRDLIPQLAEKFHVIAPDYVGFGYSDAPDAGKFDYTFDNLAAHIEELLFGVLGLKKFSIYVQDY